MSVTRSIDALEFIGTQIPYEDHSWYGKISDIEIQKVVFLRTARDAKLERVGLTFENDEQARKYSEDSLQIQGKSGIAELISLPPVTRGVSFASER